MLEKTEKTRGDWFVLKALHIGRSVRGYFAAISACMLGMVTRSGVERSSMLDQHVSLIMIRNAKKENAEIVITRLALFPRSVNQMQVRQECSHMPVGMVPERHHGAVYILIGTQSDGM